MIQNYIQVALRNILTNKLYGAINIVGLAIGLAACVLIMLFVRDELSFDRFWAKADNIYRMHTMFTVPGRQPFVSTGVPGPTKAALETYFPEEIEHAARIAQMQPVVNFGDKVFYERVHWVDPELLDIFDLPVVAGDMKSALRNNSSLAVNQRFAEKYFGENDAIGQVITMTTYGLVRDYEIVAVFENMPHNTVLEFQAFTVIDEQDFVDQSGFFEQWFSINTWLYFSLNEGSSIDHINDQITDFTDTVIVAPGAFADGTKPSDIITFSTMELTDLQLNAPAGREMKPVGDQQIVWIFTAIAGLVLLIACINFTNLATAKSTQRSREVALRKVLGARRSQLVQQFVGESVLLSGIALLLAVVLVELLLPTYSAFLGRPLEFDYTGGFGLGLLVGLVAIVGGVAGFYPAIVLSGFRPARVLKANQSPESQGSSRLRAGLVVLQFAISIALIVATAVVYGQMVFTTTLDPGFKKENLLVIRNVSRQGVQDKQTLLKQQIEKLPGVVSLTYSDSVPGSSDENNSSVSVPGNEELDDILIGRQAADYDFFSTYQIPIIAGRDYSRDFSGDGIPDFESATPGDVLEGTLIVNQSALKRLGFGSPDEAVGRLVEIRNGRPGGDNTVYAHLRLVGIVPDVHLQSLRSVIRPEMYYLVKDNFRNLTVRYSGDPNAVIDRIETLWQEIAPTVPFSYSFVDEAMARQFVQEENLATMLGTFASLAILVACMGLYGLASFTAERRTREIGIRKVMGARVLDIVRLLIWQFSKPILIANLIAWPVAAWGMLAWLEAFPYRLDAWFLAPLCLLAGGLALAIAWITVGGNAARVARANPIKALRYE